MSKYQISGLVMVVLSIMMFIYAASMFTYQGSPLSQFLTKTGEYSFFLWLPTLIIGLVFLFIRKKN